MKVLDAEPRMRYTKELHLIQGELSLLKRTLSATQHLVHMLANRDPVDQAPFLSKLTKTYLHDVLDHCSSVNENLDALDKVSEDLINLVSFSFSFSFLSCISFISLWK